MSLAERNVVLPTPDLPCPCPCPAEDWLLGRFSRESVSLMSSATGEVAGLEVGREGGG